MSPTIRHKCKYFHSAAQRAKDRRQKFHFCRLQFDVRPLNGKLNLSINALDHTYVKMLFDFLYELYYMFSLDVIC